MDRVVYTVVAVAALFAAAVPASAQLSPAEAQRRMMERHAQREAERNKLVSITAGELADLRERVKDLEEEVRALRGGAGTRPTTAATGGAKKMPTSIEAGMTRAELDRFVKSKLGALRMTTVSSTVADGKRRETVRVDRVGKASRQVGSRRDSLGSVRPVYDNVEVVQGSANVTIEDGVVTSVSQ